MLRGQTALLRRGHGRVAHGSVRIDVLRDPSEAVLVCRAQMLVTFLHLGGLRREQLRLGHVDEIGPEIEHERSLDVAGVNAMAGVEGGIKSRGQAELAMTILRKPARCTPSPISNQLQMRLSAEWVMVPPERRCSLDFPIVWVGRNSTLRSSGRRPSTVLIRPSAIAVSVKTGRCGPCCSVEATGKIASVEFGSSPANSLDLSSAQNRLAIMSPSVPI